MLQYIICIPCVHYPKSSLLLSPLYPLPQPPTLLPLASVTLLTVSMSLSCFPLCLIPSLVSPSPQLWQLSVYSLCPCMFPLCQFTLFSRMHIHGILFIPSLLSLCYTDPPSPHQHSETMHLWSLHLNMTLSSSLFPPPAPSASTL